jgi:hypothetical protein
VYKDESFTRSYLYWALSEPFVIKPGVQYCIATGNDKIISGNKINCHSECSEGNEESYGVEQNFKK